MSQKQVIKNTDELVAIFHKCHNILRNNEGIVGLKALTEFSDLLFLKLLEPMIESEEIKLPKYCKFSEFSKMPEEEMYEHIKNKVWQQLWKLIPDVYHGNYLEIKYPHTLKEIINVLDSVDFDHTATDIKGSAYEHFISRELVGKTLGQFFTPRQVVNEMIEYVKPKINKDGTSETIYDPACGTGGFLVQAFNYLKKQKGVDLKWIQKNAVHGSEINSDTVRICKLNMLCAGDGRSNIVKRDSLRYCPEETYDIVLANPPFGIKGIKFDMLGVKYPIESNTAEFLFLENIVKVMKKGGRAAVIIPDGVLFKTGVGTKLREWFLKEVKLERVVSLSQGTFDYAGVKTAILYFSKPEKEIKEGKFQTEKVEFGVFGEKETVVISLKELSKKEYVLIPKMYSSDKEQFPNVAVSKKQKIGDLIDYLKTPTTRNFDNIPQGSIPMISCSVHKNYSNYSDYSGEYIFVGSRGNGIGDAVHYVKGNFSVGTSVFTFKSKDEKILKTKFLYYTLLKNKNLIKEKVTGAAIPMISKGQFDLIEIDYPSIPEQEEFVEKMDFIHEQLNKSKVVVVENIQKEIEIIVKSFRGQKVKLSDLVDIKGGRLESKYAKEDGQYPFFVCGAEVLKIDKADYDQEAVLLAGTGEVYAFYYNGKFNARQKVHILTKKKDSPVEIDMKLLYYIINNNLDYFRARQQGATMKNVDQDNVMGFEFNLPEDPKKSLEQLQHKTQIIELIKKDLMNNDN